MDVGEDIENRVRCAYEDLKAILSKKDLPPSVKANSIQALAAVWLMVNDLNLGYEMLYDYGA